MQNSPQQRGLSGSRVFFHPARKKLTNVPLGIQLLRRTSGQRGGFSHQAATGPMDILPSGGVMASDVLVLGYKVVSDRHKMTPWHVQGAQRGVLPFSAQVGRVCWILLEWNSEGFHYSGSLKGSSYLQHSCRCIPKGRIQSSMDALHHPGVRPCLCPLCSSPFPLHLQNAAAVHPC